MSETIKIKAGDIVDYHSIIDGHVTLKDCTVLCNPYPMGGSIESNEVKL